MRDRNHIRAHQSHQLGGLLTRILSAIWLPFAVGTRPTLLLRGRFSAKLIGAVRRGEPFANRFGGLTRPTSSTTVTACRRQPEALDRRVRGNGHASRHIRVTVADPVGNTSIVRCVPPQSDVRWDLLEVGSTQQFGQSGPYDLRMGREVMAEGFVLHPSRKLGQYAKRGSRRYSGQPPLPCATTSARRGPWATDPPRW
jgi:hypothetical protein